MRPRASRVSSSARPPWGTCRPDASSESVHDAVAERTVGPAEGSRLTAERNDWRRAERARRQSRKACQPLGRRAAAHRVAGSHAPGESANGLPRPGPVAQLLDADVDVVRPRRRLPVVEVAVDVDASIRHVAQRHVGQQQRRVPGGIQRAVNLVSSKPSMSTSPTGLTSWFPMTSIFRPGALRSRLSMVPEQAIYRDVTQADDRVSRGSPCGANCGTGRRPLSSQAGIRREKYSMHRVGLRSTWACTGGSRSFSRLDLVERLQGRCVHARRLITAPGVVCRSRGSGHLPALRVEVLHPVVHEWPPRVEQVAPRIRRFGLVAYDVRERSLHHRPRVIRPLGRPVPERRPEAMRNGPDPQLLEQLREPRIGELLAARAGKDQPGEL